MMQDSVVMIAPGAARSPAAWTYEDALAFWYGRINYEQQSPLPGDFKLERMRAFLQRFGNPQQRLRILHVAGSKGKGSTSAMLAAILQRAGYCTGLFTSPHLCAVEERIQVNGQRILAEELTALLDEVRTALETGDRLEPTFFEITVALGFLHFVRRSVDVAVVEVGLGGRLDATNVCNPVLAIIASISFDHTQLLGNHLASIAWEKAGIIKPGRPVISGATPLEARAVIRQLSQELHAPLRELGVDFHYRYQPGLVSDKGRSPSSVQVTTDQRAWPAQEMDLLGQHQAANAAVAVAAVEQLRAEGWRVGDPAVTAGLAQVSWPARIEVLCRAPLVVLDCAHNVASAEALVQTLQASFPLGRRLLVFACSSDKDVTGMVQVLGQHFVHAYLTRYHNNPRGMPVEELAEMFRRNSAMPVSLCATPSEAWRAARTAAKDDDLICVTGSVFLAGELRPKLAGGYSSGWVDQGPCLVLES